MRSVESRSGTMSLADRVRHLTMDSPVTRHKWATRLAHVGVTTALRPWTATGSGLPASTSHEPAATRHGEAPSLPAAAATTSSAPAHPTPAQRVHALHWEIGPPESAS